VQQQAARLRGKVQMALILLGQKMLQQKENVFWALAQGRDDQRQRVEAIEQIFAELSGLYALSQVAKQAPLILSLLGLASLLLWLLRVQLKLALIGSKVK